MPEFHKLSGYGSSVSPVLSEKLSWFIKQSLGTDEFEIVEGHRWYFYLLVDKSLLAQKALRSAIDRSFWKSESYSQT
jgi:hypothetical protein